ncbi:YlbF family regulator [Tepidibacter aestuarii]|uniref:YlbF family regulator n=1 Tax=Tepidibacter aestuarii TaxID=2925782 RepID=UPI0020C122D7|nr:YlbF family regulator [Tepidibacter aestuarii]CAH2214971.1 Control of competence regulator ComK, YlbF/YmcA [Tepidibacter aestuarii]
MKNKTKELVELICKTDEFKRLKNAKKNIDKNKNLKKQVEDFKKRQLKIQKSKLSKEQLNSEMTRLDHDFKVLHEIPQVNEFFKSTQEFNSMMFNLFKEINILLDSRLNSK